MIIRNEKTCFIMHNVIHSIIIVTLIILFKKWTGTINQGSAFIKNKDVT